MRRCVMGVGLVKSSALASILIGFGVVGLLYLGQPLGPIIFAFGLLSVCVLKADLFTGKAGFYWRDKKKELFYILCINLAIGYIFGNILGLMDNNLIPIAQEKILSQDNYFIYSIKSVLCGMIMYIAVRVYQKGSFLGILYGIPLFIFCGFKHCIANIIIIGIAGRNNFDLLLELLICICGNLFGSIIINILEEK